MFESPPQCIESCACTIIAAADPHFFSMAIIVAALAVPLILWKVREPKSRCLAIFLAVIGADLGLIGLMPAWVELAKSNTPLSEGIYAWMERAEGFFTADVPLFKDGVLVDIINVTKVDSSKFDMSVDYDPVTPVNAEGWRNRLGAIMVVNGSYYDDNRLPLAPLVSKGKKFGPSEYQSDHGYLSLDSRPDIVEMTRLDPWAQISSSQNAMTSFPLLLSRDHTQRYEGKENWNAARTFVAIAKSGEVLFCTTTTGYFSLPELSRYLANSSLGIVSALNMDGGPITQKAIQIGDYHYFEHGRWEYREAPPFLKAATHVFISFDLGVSTDQTPWKLPIVIVVKRK